MGSPFQNDPPSVPTFFLGYLGEHVRHGEDGAWEIDDRAAHGPWHTGDRVTRTRTAGCTSRGAPTT